LEKKTTNIKGLGLKKSLKEDNKKEKRRKEGKA
jgi:hypothetical protein